MGAATGGPIGLCALKIPLEVREVVELPGLMCAEPPVEVVAWDLASAFSARLRPPLPPGTNYTHYLQICTLYRVGILESFCRCFEWRGARTGR